MSMELAAKDALTNVNVNYVSACHMLFVEALQLSADC